MDFPTRRVYYEIVLLFVVAAARARILTFDMFAGAVMQVASVDYSIIGL